MFRVLLMWMVLRLYLRITILKVKPQGKNLNALPNFWPFSPQEKKKDESRMNTFRILLLNFLLIPGGSCSLINLQLQLPGWINTVLSTLLYSTQNNVYKSQLPSCFGIWSLDFTIARNFSIP